VTCESETAAGDCESRTSRVFSAFQFFDHSGSAGGGGRSSIKKQFYPSSDSFQEAYFARLACSDLGKLSKSRRSGPPARPVNHKLQRLFPFFLPLSLTQSEATVDFLGGLVRAGITSVPTRLPLCWSASQWAVIRYVAAADHTIRRLRLHAPSMILIPFTRTCLAMTWGRPATPVASDQVALQVRRPRGIRNAGPSRNGRSSVC
jgi:hypothetical protein